MCKWKIDGIRQSISTKKIYLAKLKVNVIENRGRQNYSTNKKCPSTLKKQKNDKQSK